MAYYLIHYTTHTIIAGQDCHSCICSLLLPPPTPQCLEDIWLQGISMCKRHAKPDRPCLHLHPKIRGQHTISPGIFKCYGLAHFPCTPDLDLLLYSQDKNVDLGTSSERPKVRILFCIYSVCRVNESLIPSKYAFSTSVLKDTKRRVQLGPLGVQSAQDCPGAVLFTSQGSTDQTQSYRRV